MADAKHRQELNAQSERKATLSALREGLADVKAGRTKPARNALRALKKKYGIRHR